jgi:hypothetical protein
MFPGNTATMVLASTMNLGLLLIIIGSCYPYKNLQPIIQVKEDFGIILTKKNDSLVNRCLLYMIHFDLVTNLSTQNEQASYN